MNYRKSNLYKNLTPKKAILLVKGRFKGKTANQEEEITAWQFILDKNIYSKLDNWHGKVLDYFIDEGIIKTS